VQDRHPGSNPAGGGRIIQTNKQSGPVLPLPALTLIGRYPVRKPIAECTTGPRFNQIANALIATMTTTKIRI
jgi:hypothetical protein